ncbi:MAG: hypothetical protein SYC29_00300, partial [Planctomycetota bacterium]|nr:hypothetical protein [Planctomycetota bacterium]
MNRGRRTIGYHLVKSAYGQWLPGDEAGHWSTAWDERIGYLHPKAWLRDLVIFAYYCIRRLTTTGNSMHFLNINYLFRDKK